MRLLEALKPSEYRQFMKAAKIAGSKYKTDFNNVFAKYASSQDKSKYRIYIPLSGSDEDIQAPQEIVKYIGGLGYTVTDYAAGIATSNDGRRVISIGKLVGRDPEIKKIYDNDPQRSGRSKSGSEYVAVISRHPYDIAGMSTDRGWTSCMSLDGNHANYLCANVSGMTLVAYAVKVTDTNISKPAGRILIHCFVNMNDHNDYVMYPGKVYGTDVQGFSNTIEAWCKENWPLKPGKYKLPSDKYDDGMEKFNIPDDLTDKSPKEIQDKFSNTFGYFSPNDYNIHIGTDENNKSEVSLSTFELNISDMQADRLPVNMRNITTDFIRVIDSTFKSFIGFPKKFKSLEFAANKQKGAVTIDLVDLPNIKSLAGLPIEFDGVSDFNLRLKNINGTKSKLTDLTAIDSMTGFDSINLDITVDILTEIKEFPKKIPFKSINVRCGFDKSSSPELILTKPILVADGGAVKFEWIRYVYQFIDVSAIQRIWTYYFI